MTLREQVSEAARRLEAAGITAAEAALDAELLARDLLGWDRARWITRHHQPAPPEFEARYAAVLARRIAREPIAYIRGRQEFYGREFLVTRAVLVPRPETELLVDEALLLLPALGFSRTLTVVDIGTGSGCLVVTLALEYPGATYIATDTSRAALDVAEANARRHGVADRIRFVEGRYFADVHGPINVALSNPPYVREIDRDTLPPEVLRYEPASALFAGPDGLRDIRHIVREAAGVLDADGTLLIEIGFGQLADVAAAVEETAHLAVVRARPDLQDIPRVAVIRRCR